MIKKLSARLGQVGTRHPSPQSPPLVDIQLICLLTQPDGAGSKPIKPTRPEKCQSRCFQPFPLWFASCAASCQTTQVGGAQSLVVRLIASWQGSDMGNIVNKLLPAAANTAQHEQPSNQTIKQKILFLCSFEGSVAEWQFLYGTERYSGCSI